MTDFDSLNKACAEGNVNLVQQLMSKDKANLTDGYNNTPLHVAAFHGQLEAALVLINQFDCDVNIKGNKGRSVLHQACAGGNVRLVQSLILEHEADIYSRDDENNTPLHVAAIYGADKVVLALIKQFKCDVDGKGNFGRSVLHCACYNGHLNLITAIGKSGSPTIDNDGNTPLHLSCARGHVECVKALLALDAPVLMRNKDGNTPREVAQDVVKPIIDKFLLDKFGFSATKDGFGDKLILHHACQEGNITLIESLILKHKANVTARDTFNNTPLHVAAFNGREKIALILIDHFKCDIDVKGYNGTTALHCACYNGHHDVVTAIGMEASLSAVDDEGNTPLHICCARGHVECMKVLLALDAPILVTNKYGNTPREVAQYLLKLEIDRYIFDKFGYSVSIHGNSERLLLHDACRQGDVALIQKILEHKGDVNFKDDDNNTPLHVAALHGNEEAALTLINQFGFNNVDIKGYNDRSVLHQACIGGNVSLIKTLILTHKASVTAKDFYNDTPLHVAALHGQEQVLLILINQFKCDVDVVKGYHGRSVLHHACHKGHDKVISAIGKYASLLAVDDDGNTPLHLSCAGGHVECVKTLLELNAPILVTNKDGNTPSEVAQHILVRIEIDKYLFNKFGYFISLHGYIERLLLHDACKQGGIGLIQKILELKGDVNFKDDDNNTPLHVAALHGNEEAALTLINQFGFNNVDIKGYNDRSVLHQACIGGNVSLIKTLILTHKASVTARDCYNDTPLHVAALHGQERVLLILINQFKCDVDVVKGYHGRSVLHHACHKGHDKVISAIGKYASLLAVDDDGNTPLHLSCAGGHVECVKTLLELNAPILVTNKYGKTSREVAEHFVRTEIDAYLLHTFGYSVSLHGNSERLLLHDACKEGGTALIQKILEHKGDVNFKDDDNNTPLHVAALHGNKEAALTLINQFGFNNVDIKGYQDRSVLHQACIGGNVRLVHDLILYHKADITAKDCDGNTPFHVAKSLCDVDMKGHKGQTLLHKACSNGNVTLVQSLVHEHKANVNARDDDNNTPLHVAALHGNEEAALTLINQFGFNNVDIKGYQDRSVLHQACIGGNVSLIETLIHTHKASVATRDCNNDTPLHVAALYGKEQVLLILINQFKCDVDVKGYHGRSALHHACHKGHDKVVSAIGKYASLLTVDDDGNTPLHLSCAGGHVEYVKTLLELIAPILVSNKDGKTPREVANHLVRTEIDKYLIDKFGYSVNLYGNSERSLLHDACKQGDVSLIQKFIHEHKADIYFKDDDNNTPLHVAALHGNEEAALTLINQFRFNNVDIKGYQDRSVLHQACIGGNISLIKTLILTHKASVTARDCNNDTPLHVAALYGKEQVLLILINQFKCDVEVKGYRGRSALHHACHKGHDKVVSAIGKYASLLAVDDVGNTPLHTCSAKGHVECVKVLLAFNAPVLVRNKSGMTPREIAEDSIVPVIDNYVLQNQDKILADYKKMQEHSKKRYSKPEHITRIFVIGNPGAGKSSFVQCLKREGFLKSFIKVSESSVPRHTAGIVPSEYYSKLYGRVLFYDFAGDPEYYSSHAAILENLSFLKKGDNIFVIIADLNENDATINNLLHIWFSFIQNQKFLEEIVSLVLIGSHVDSVTKVVLQDKKKIFVDFQKYVKSRVSYKSSYHFLDCRKPRDIGGIQESIKNLTDDSPTYSLSFEASILLGLLEKDFKSVTACTLKILISHISETGLALPKNPKSLCPILHELHELGLLLVIGKSEIEGDVQIVLNISQLTNDVHRLLFSKASVNLGFFSNFGIVPESSLLKILPKYITKECLIQLQYCQEISHRNIGMFSFPSQSCTPNKSFLYFPSLCSVDKSEVSWDETFSDAKLDYSIGWLAECTEASNYFPARFLHVLLLRLIFRFSKRSTSDEEQNHYRCSLWKTGVQWPMEEGVLCMVELTDNSKKLVVVTKSEEALAHNCISVFNRIFRCVMEAKAEFCHSIKPEFFLLATTEETNYLDRDNLVALCEVKEALNSPETNEFILSVTGKRSIRRSKISCMHKQTHWNSLFPMDLNSVLSYLENVVKDLHNLSGHLNIPHSVFKAVELNYPRDVDRCKKELVVKWMSSSIDPPCWWHLVEALKKIKMNVLADKIEKENHPQVELQKKLLDQGNHSLKPDVEFIELFSILAELDWSSLASLLLLTSSEIEEVKEEGEGLSQEHHAHLMLRKWVSREDATYGQLYQKLKTISLFQY